MKYLPRLVVALGTLIVSAVTAQAQPIPVSLPTDIMAEPDEEIVVPIIVGNLTGAQILSYTTAISFDAGVVRALGASAEGTLSEPFGEPTVEIEPNQILLAASGDKPLSGSGVLVNLEFEVVGEPDDMSDLVFNFFIFNAAIPEADTSNGKITVIPPPTPQISVTPGAHDFGAVFVNETAAQEFTIANQGDTTLVVTQLSLSGIDAGEFDLTGVQPPIMLDAGESSGFMVVFMPVMPGSKTATVEIMSNDPDDSLVAVPLSGAGELPPEPDIVVAPEALQFGEIPVMNTTAPQTISIRNEGEANLVLQSVRLVGQDSADFAIAFSVSDSIISPGESDSLAVRFAPTSPGAKQANVFIESNDPDEPQVSVLLSGTGVAAPMPEIQVTPLQVQFGLVAVNATALRIVTVTNVGTADLTVSELTLLGAQAKQFELMTDDVPFTLVPQESREIEVVFAPKQSGAANALLRIASNDPEQPVVDVPLSGRAAAALAIVTSIVSPADGSFACADTAVVEVAVETFNAVAPAETTCTVNNVVASLMDGRFVATVRLDQPENTIIATCTVTDSLGRTNSAADTIVVKTAASPACQITIVAPVDGDIVVTDSVTVLVQFERSGGVPPISQQIEINGVTARQQDSLFAATLACKAGEFDIVAVATVQDSCGEIATCRDSIRIECRPREERILIGVDEDSGVLIRTDLRADTPELEVVGRLLFYGKRVSELEAMAVDAQSRRVFMHANSDGGRLFSFSFDSIPVPPDTGRISLVLRGKTGSTHIDGIAFHNGRLFGSDTQRKELLEIDPGAGSVTAIGKLGFTNVEGLAFSLDEASILFGIDNDSQKLITIATETGAGRKVSGAKIAFENVEALVFDEDGSLFGFSNGDEQQFIRIDPVSGTATAIAVAGVGKRDIEGLAFVDLRSDAPVSVPRTPAPGLPASFELHQNYPNPFNPTTTISFEIAGSGTGEVVQIQVFNITGQLLQTLIDATMSPGSYQTQWDGRDRFGRAAPSGVYVYRMRVGEHAQSRRMLLLK